MAGNTVRSTIVMPAESLVQLKTAEDMAKYIRVLRVDETRRHRIRKVDWR